MFASSRVSRGAGATRRNEGQQNAPVAPAGLDGTAALQRTIGNRALVALLAAGQAKLTVGAADDRYEREADVVAGEVVSRLRSGAGDSGGHAGHDHPASQLDEDQRAGVGRMLSRLQRQVGGSIGAAGGDVDWDTESRIAAARSGGKALPGGMQRSMESAFGADFSNVKLHSGEQASALNDSVGAAAFTVGSDIFLGHSTPDLASSAGQGLLAHELAHTIQQGASSVEEKR